MTPFSGPENSGMRSQPPRGSFQDEWHMNLNTYRRLILFVPEFAY